MPEVTMEARIAHLEGAFDQVSKRLDSIDRRLETGLVELRGDMNQRFSWLLGIVLGTWITTMLTLLFHHG